MSPSPSTDSTGPTRRAVILSGSALALLSGLGVLWPDPAEAEAGTPLAAAVNERPHRTLLGLL
jgi:hypothetical protein